MQKIGDADAHGIREGPKFLQLSMQFTTNRGPQQRNNFNYPILVFMLNLILLITTSGEVHLKNPFGTPQAEVDFACVYNL